MLESLVIGSGFALAAAVSPGPLQAFLLSSVARRGWKRTLPAACAPLLSDGPIVLLVLFVLNRVPQTMSTVLRAAGGVLLIYLAWAGYRQWRKQSTPSSETGESAPRTFIQAATVNFLNPNVYLSWSLVMGPAVLAAWRASPAHAVAFLAAFYATMVTALAGTILLFGTTSWLGPRGRRALILVSAILLAALGVYQLASLLREV